jgi:hypothetical protein
MTDRLVKYECASGHSISLRMDGQLAEEVRARRSKTKKCEVGVGSAPCGAPLKEVGEAQG